jgi:hypothetical protein
MHSFLRKRARRGIGVPEFFAVVGGVTVVIMIGVSQVGDAAKSELQQTSEDMLNPAALANKYKGNNGFGNGGGDGSPNGMQDETR